MDQETAPNLHNERQDRISILAVVTAERTPELERIVSHTRWQMHVVHSIHEAIQALRALPISVVLCEHRLPDGVWLDIVRETEQRCPRPQVIVLSAFADFAIWEEVLNCGGYDLLAMPLEPREVYEVVPVAWRQSKCVTEKVSAPELNSKRRIAKAS